MKKLIFIFLFISYSVFSNAQHLTHDLGVHIGTSVFQTDYGVRNNYLSSFGNRGIYMSISHSTHFFHNNRRWNYDDLFWNHITLKNEISFVSKTNLNHYGSLAESNTTLGD